MVSPILHDNYSNLPQTTQHRENGLLQWITKVTWITSIPNSSTVSQNFFFEIVSSCIKKAYHFQMFTQVNSLAITINSSAFKLFRNFCEKYSIWLQSCLWLSYVFPTSPSLIINDLRERDDAIKKGNWHELLSHKKLFKKY